MRLPLSIILSAFLFANCAGDTVWQQNLAHSKTDTATKAKPVKEPALVLQGANSDTLFVDTKAAIFVTPDDAQIEKQKKLLGEESFYTAADDNMFYMSNARDFLDSIQLPVIDVKKKKFIKFIQSSESAQIINLRKLPALWNIYFFQPGQKAKPIEMTSPDEAYKNYFR